MTGHEGSTRRNKLKGQPGEVGWGKEMQFRHTVILAITSVPLDRGNSESARERHGRSRRMKHKYVSRIKSNHLSFHLYRHINLRDGR